MNILETIKIEKKTRVKISFEMKDSLKKAIPSAKWIATDKLWEVGPRSSVKLENWISSARKEFDIKSIQDKKNSFAEKIEESKEILGHTYSFKEVLKSKYNGFFNDGKWMVSADVYDQAQNEINNLNDERKSNRIKKNEIKNERDVGETLDLLEKIGKNYEKLDNYEYLFQDDYFYIKFGKYRDDEETYKKITSVWDELQQYVTFADENDNPGIKYDDNLKDVLELFKIPQTFIIDFSDNKFIENNEAEDTVEATAEEIKMLRKTKQKISKALEFKKNGELTAKTINTLKNFRRLTSGDSHYMISTGRGRNTKYSSSLNLGLLIEFCFFSRGNDSPRGGVMGDYISISNKEIKLLNKRLDYFLLEIEEDEREIKEQEDKEQEDKEKVLAERRETVKKIIDNLDGKVENWIKLPKEMKHPAPDYIYDLKVAYCLSWREFAHFVTTLDIVRG